MSNNSDNHPKQAHKASALEKFNLGFEYDMSWRDAKKSLKERTA